MGLAKPHLTIDEERIVERPILAFVRDHPSHLDEELVGTTGDEGVERQLRVD
jgi:hypothetical protein